MAEMRRGHNDGAERAQQGVGAGEVWYGWRLDPRELVKAPAEQPGAAQTREGQQEGRRGC